MSVDTAGKRRYIECGNIQITKGVNIMKELYLNPEMDVIKLTDEDVITTSGTEETWGKPTYGNEFDGNWGGIPDSGNEW